MLCRRQDTTPATAIKVDHMQPRTAWWPSMASSQIGSQRIGSTTSHDGGVPPVEVLLYVTSSYALCLVLCSGKENLVPRAGNA
jgi:hypothetical protein